MSSYFFTSSLNRVVSSIKKTVNELINENSVEEEGKSDNVGLEELNDGTVDIITSRARRISKPEFIESSLIDQPEGDSKRRLSLVEIFGEDKTTPSNSTKDTDLHIVNRPTTLSNSSKPMPLLETGRQKSSNLPSLPEEDDSEKSAENLIQQPNATSHSSENLDVDKVGSDHSIKSTDDLKATPDPADAVGL